MELLLNLIWMAIAGGLTVFLLRQRRAPLRSWSVVLVAALFIAVLLFPAISASDDLHSDPFLFEDASRRTPNLLSAHPDIAPAVALFFPLRISLSIKTMFPSGSFADAPSLILLPSFSRPASGLRAPPVSSSL